MNYKLKKWSKELNFIRYNNCAYGNLGGYLFSVCKKQWEYHLFVMTGFPDQNTRYRVNQLLHNNNMLQDFCISSVTVEDTGITFIFSAGGRGFKHMKRFVVWLMPVLRRNGMLDEGFCGLCHRPLENEYSVRIMKDKKVIRVHEECLREYERTYEREKEMMKKEKGYLFGFICACAGTIIGSLPSLLLSLIAPVFGILSMLPVFGAYKGYEISGAKRGKPAALILVLSTLIIYNVVLIEIFLLKAVADKLYWVQFAYTFTMSLFCMLITYLFVLRDIADVQKNDYEFIVVK